jgi:hypothetical protein
MPPLPSAHSRRGRHDILAGSLLWAELRAIGIAHRCTRGPCWLLFTAIYATAVCLVYAWPSYHAMEPEPPAWRARAAQIAQPFNDPSRDFDPRAHESKRTFRLTVPLAAHVLGLGRHGVIALLHLCGFLTFLAAGTAAYRMTGDRVAAFLAVMMTATIPTGALAFWDFDNFFYDGVALAALTAAVACRTHWLVALLVFVAAWTDERGLIASSLLFLYFWYDAAHTSDAKQAMRSRQCVWAVAAAWAAYAFGRTLLSWYCAFHTATGDVGFSVALSQINLITIASWGGLEGGWLLVLAACIVLWAVREFFFAALFLGAMAVVSAVACSVFDLTRSFAYLYPAVFVALRVLHAHVPLRSMRRLLLICLGLSALWLNLWVTGTNLVYLMKPAPLRLLHFAIESISR